MKMEKILFNRISMALIFFALITTQLFTSCSSNDEEQASGNQQPVKLIITADISTRAANAAWAAGDKYTPSRQYTTERSLVPINHQRKISP